MENTQLTICFNRLVKSLQINKGNPHGITIFLGAGCSLTSSPKNITTYNIVRELTRQYSLGNPVPDEWHPLYQTFVNTVWNGQGKKDKVQLLQNFFVNMSPSPGYKTLRWLLDHGYISNIITTNFDLMLDQALDGLSYHLSVGERSEEVGKGPFRFSLIKAHGDLRLGELRFAPGELSQLPPLLSSEINRLTQNPVIVIGFRGQDIGILNALYDTDEYNAYWVSLEKPDEYNASEYERVYTWMQKRNSINNFLYGEEFGTFDNLLLRIRQALIAYEESDKRNRINSFQEIWKESDLYTYILINRRFEKLFIEFQSYIEEKAADSLWKPVAPFYAASFHKLLDSAIKLLNPGIIPASYYCIKNEVDALLISVICSVWLCCQGCADTNLALIDYLHERFKREHSEITICSDFWEIIKSLSDPDNWFIDKFRSATCEVSFEFDLKRGFSVILKKVELAQISRLFEILEILLHFVQTSGSESIDVYKKHLKQTLEKHLYHIQKEGNDIILKMTAMPLQKYREIYMALLERFFSEHKVGEHQMLYHSPIYADFTIDIQPQASNMNIWENLFYTAGCHVEKYLKDFKEQTYILRAYLNIYEDFLHSHNNGLFVIGESGCGKTVSLKQWICRLKEEYPEKYILFPVLGRDQNDCSKPGAQLFGEHFFNHNALGYLQIMLSQRGQTLILLMDAINEIHANFTCISTHYSALLDFCDELSEKEIWNIRVVISCRTDSYNQIKRSTRRSPSERSFFSTMENGTVDTVYKIPYYDQSDIQNYIHKTNVDLDYQFLYREFGKLIFSPFNLKIICDAYQKNDNPLPFLTKWNVFDKWFENVKAHASEERIPSEFIEKIINYTVCYKYFSAQNDELKTHMLSSAFATEIPNAIAIYEWLACNRVYDKSEIIPNMVLFSHDSIEEYFLSRFILSEYSEKVHEIDCFISPIYWNTAVSNKALQNVCYRLYHIEPLQFTNALVHVLRNQKEDFLAIFIKAIFQIINLSPKQGENLLKTFQQYVLLDDFTMFLHSFLTTFSNDLDSLMVPNLSCIQIINHIIDCSECRNNNILYATGLYLWAKSLFMLPAEDSPEKYEMAFQKCIQAEEHLQSPDYVLADQIQTLKALLLQTKGDLNASIKIMESCYKKQIRQEKYDEACISALNLGAMYREMAQFDKALEIYENVDTSLIQDQTNLYRLIMNQGIIYKNKVQNSLFEGEKKSPEIIGFYQLAQKSFEKTCDFAESQDDIPLCLEIYAELVENACNGYYLSQETIAQADFWVKKMGKVIGRYPVPVERIQYERMQARVLALKGKLKEAIGCLEKGFEIAIEYNIPFRATDCCNQITGIISSNLDNPVFLSKEILQKGMDYGDYAIRYYENLDNPEHRYLQDSIYKYHLIKNSWGQYRLS